MVGKIDVVLFKSTTSQIAILLDTFFSGQSRLHIYHTD